MMFTGYACNVLNTRGKSVAKCLALALPDGSMQVHLHKCGIAIDIDIAAYDMVSTLGDTTTAAHDVELHSRQTMTM